MLKKMILVNIVKKDIRLNSFEGYKFSVPPGISWIWDEAGKEMLRVYSPPVFKLPVDKFGNPNGNGIPAIRRATLKEEKEWEKERKIAIAERFKINHAQIPRKKLITIAQQRGIESGKITEWLADEQIDSSVIAEVINELPVPDEIRFPKILEEIKT